MTDTFTRLCAQYAAGALDWADLLEITGLSPADLYAAMTEYGAHILTRHTP